MVITEHISGQTVEHPAGASAQEVVDSVVAQLGLPRRTEDGIPINYRLLANGNQMVPDAPVTSDVELHSEIGREVYERVTASLDEIEAAVDGEEPPVHLSTRLAVARRTGALPGRVEALDQSFQAQVFRSPETVAPAKKRRWLPMLGGTVLVAFFGWLFWVTEPDTPDLVIAQESADEVTVLDGPAEVEGRIEVNREVDLYTFMAEEGDFVTVAMLATGNVNFEGFDAELSVDGPDGGQVAYNDDFNGLNSQVSFEVDQAGEYTIRARSLNGCCVGDYALIFEIAR